MKRSHIKQWTTPILVVATLAVTGGVLAAEQYGPSMSDRGRSGYMQPRHMGYGGYGHGPDSVGMLRGSMMGGVGTRFCGGMDSGVHGSGMGFGAVGALDLTDDQRDKIKNIYDDVRRKNWENYGKIMDEQSKLRELYTAEIVDAKKVGSVYGSLSKLNQQVIENYVEAHNRVQALLTKEQKEKSRQRYRGDMGRHGMMGSGGHGPSNMPHDGMGMGPGMMHR